MTTALTTQDAAAEVQTLLDSPMTATETQELKACELQIELAGKDRLEKALVIGEKLSTIYNLALFRGEGGRSWGDWVAQRLPEILPEAGGAAWADDRRCLFEVRTCLSTNDVVGGLPAGVQIGRDLKALIPKRFDGPGGWNPSELDQPAEGLKAVWELAQRNAAQQQRKNGPTIKDVTNAREELRPMLLERGLIREAPKHFQHSTAERMAAAQLRREQTVDVETDQQRQARLANQDRIRKEAAERQRNAQANAVQEQLQRAEREAAEALEDKVREYNRHLIQAYDSIHELLIFLRSIDRINGTQYLQEMRATDVMGLITVRDDKARIQGLGAELMEIAELVNSCGTPSGIDMTTYDVAAE